MPEQEAPPSTSTPLAVEQEERSITFLGRPARVVTLGRGSSGAAGERPHKRPRSEGGGEDGDGDAVAGGVRQVVRSMLRAHRLGVLTQRVLHVDPATGSAVVAQVAARTLGELMAAAAAAAAAEEAAAAATAAGGVAAAAGDVAAAAGDVAAAVTAGADEPVKAAEVAAVAEEAAGTATAVAVKAAGPAGAEDAAARAAGLDRAASALGRALAVLHDGGQVHGSLSCGTVLLRDSDGAVVLTDFRRSRNTGLALDKAQDLAALEAALPAGAAHASAAEALFSKILTAYRSASRQWSATHNKLAEVRSRSGQANKKLKATETKG